MKPEFIQCEFCKTKISSEACKLAAYRTQIDGKEYVFCCVQCAKKYHRKKKANAKSS